MTEAPSGKTPAKDVLVKITATFFGAGYSPWAPGTMGSLAGIMIAWFVGPSAYLYLAVFAALGFLVCPASVRVFNSTDPSMFVMDEVCGVMIAALLVPRTIAFYAGAFILFRLFDIAKPWPISIIQKSKRPSAIMWDDVLAGVFANLVLRGILLLLNP